MGHTGTGPYGSSNDGRMHEAHALAACYGPLEPVTFVFGDGLLRTEWQVTMMEDGTLMVIASGRRPGRVLAESRSNTTIGITTDRLVIEGHNSVLTEPSSDK